VQTADGIEQFQEAIGAAVPPAAYCADLWAQHHTKCKSINKPIGGKLSCHALKTGLAHMQVDLASMSIPRSLSLDVLFM